MTQQQQQQQQQEKQNPPGSSSISQNLMSADPRKNVTQQAVQGTIANRNA